jgi:hypothetical protein
VVHAREAWLNLHLQLPCSCDPLGLADGLYQGGEECKGLGPLQDAAEGGFLAEAGRGRLGESELLSPERVLGF